ncbi:MAG TPA: reverse transcriptase domain-containing protein, partial [Mobilitalea sp.]|nr:reverse transcriptase domain-containing protein [Mobilitalea sp.]
GFFDHINHEWMMKFIEVKIKDPNVLGLIKKYLKAGLMEDNIYHPTEEGTVQGSNLSPVLANIYMHYVLVLWFYKEVREQMKGECHLIVYADDFVCCFQYKSEAEQVYHMLQKRLLQFNLELEASKCRLIEFGRFAEENSNPKKPETFDFLGFTHYCGKGKNGNFRVKRKTSNKKFKEKIKNFEIWMKQNRTIPLKELISKVNAKLKGHYNYYGITDNSRMICAYCNNVRYIIFKWINRRSQRNSYTWQGFYDMLRYYPLVKPKICVNIYKK